MIHGNHKIHVKSKMHVANKVRELVKAKELAKVRELVTLVKTILGKLKIQSGLASSSLKAIKLSFLLNEQKA
jgi:hypothetical protein